MADQTVNSTIKAKKKDFISQAVEKPDVPILLDVDDASRENIYNLLSQLEENISHRIEAKIRGINLDVGERTDFERKVERDVYTGLFKLAGGSFYSPKGIRDVRYVPRNLSTRGWSTLEGVFETHLGEYLGLYMFPYNDAKSILFAARPNEKRSV
jgi:hypothetical protein